MKKEYQVTILCTSGKYKPISTIVTREQQTDENLLNNPIEKKAILAEGVKKICLKHYWDKTYLKQYEYTKVKVRVYDREKIAEENRLRYEKLKEEKYSSGEWKKPRPKA